MKARWFLLTSQIFLKINIIPKHTHCFYKANPVRSMIAFGFAGVCQGIDVLDITRFANQFNEEMAEGKNTGSRFGIHVIAGNMKIII